MLRELLARFGVKFDDTELKQGSASLDGLASKMKAFAGVAAAVVIGKGILSFVDGIRDVADELDKTSIQLGLATGDLQSWRFAANLAGVEGAAFSQSLALLQRNAFEARRGSTAMADSFRQLGVELVDSNGNLKDGNTLLSEVGQGLSELTNDSEKVAISLTLMGRSGRKLLPLFTEGAEGVARAREEFEKLGGGLSEATIAASVELTDEMTRLDTALEGVRSTIALAILPTLNRAVTFFTQVSAAIGEMVKGTNIAEIVFVSLGVAALALAAKMVLAFAAPIGIFLLIVAVVGVLILVVDDLITLFQGGESVIGDFIDALFGVGTSVAVVESLTEAWEAVTESVKTAGNAVADFLGLERPFEETRLGGRADTDEGRVARRQRRSAALGGSIARTPGQGPQEQAELLREANDFRLSAGLETVLTQSEEGGVGERRIRRSDRRRQRELQEGLFETMPQEVSARTSSAASSRNVEQNNSNTFHISGSSPEENAAQVRRILTQFQGEQNIAALAALVPEAEPEAG